MAFYTSTIYGIVIAAAGVNTVLKILKGHVIMEVVLYLECLLLEVPLCVCVCVCVCIL